MSMSFHALWVEDAISYLPECTSTVCCDISVFIYQSSSNSSISVGIRWLGGKSLHTTRIIAQMFFGVVFNVSSHLYDFFLQI
jgi:hypothetical protein